MSDINGVSWNYVNGRSDVTEINAIKRLKEVCRNAKDAPIPIPSANEKLNIYISLVNPNNNNAGTRYTEQKNIKGPTYEIELNKMLGICNRETIPSNFITENQTGRDHIFLIIKALFGKRERNITNFYLKRPRSVKFPENPNIPVFFTYKSSKGGTRKTSKRKKTTRKNKSRRYSSRSTSSS